MNPYFKIRWTFKDRRRLKVVVPKKVGKAHQRNLIRRIVRECFRLNPTQFPLGDVIVVVKPPAGDLKRKAIWGSLKDSLKRTHG